MSSKEPTHRVTHATRGKDAFIYIAPSLQQKLESPHPAIRRGAESSVAINFREAYRQRHGVAPGRYVEFADLRLSEIDRTPEEPFIALTQGGEPADNDD